MTLIDLVLGRMWVIFSNFASDSNLGHLRWTRYWHGNPLQRSSGQAEEQQNLWDQECWPPLLPRSTRIVHGGIFQVLDVLCPQIVWSRKLLSATKCVWRISFIYQYNEKLSNIAHIGWMILFVFLFKKMVKFCSMIFLHKFWISCFMASTT